jgi:methionine salvage enolase-phosphatase E1
MAEETLVESLVAESVKLVRELDKQGDTPSNVLWYYFSDAEEWRLLVAGKPFDQLLPKDESQAYQKVAGAIGKANLDSLTIADVKLVRTDDALLAATKFVIKTPPDGVVRAHFRDNTFNGIFVKEMLVLRAA